MFLSAKVLRKAIKIELSTHLFLRKCPLMGFIYNFWFSLSSTISIFYTIMTTLDESTFGNPAEIFTFTSFQKKFIHPIRAMG